MLKTMIAVDGSDSARRAIDAVGALVRNGARVQVALVNVRDLPNMAFGEVVVFDWSALDQALKQRQDEVLRAAEEHARVLGLDLLPSHGVQGFASDEILRLARELVVEQIAMGTRGLGAVRSMFIGSVAQRVLHGAQVPVLLAR